VSDGGIWQQWRSTVVLSYQRIDVGCVSSYLFCSLAEFFVVLIAEIGFFCDPEHFYGLCVMQGDESTSMRVSCVSDPNVNF
jgi:hypothetical protein